MYFTVLFTFLPFRYHYHLPPACTTGMDSWFFVFPISTCTWYTGRRRKRLTAGLSSHVPAFVLVLTTLPHSFFLFSSILPIPTTAPTHILPPLFILVLPAFIDHSTLLPGWPATHHLPLPVLVRSDYFLPDFVVWPCGSAHTTYRFIPLPCIYTR